MSPTTTGLAAEIEKAMAEEYSAQGRGTLPSAGKRDRELLFAAVARGVLRYLQDNQAVVIKTITLRVGSQDLSYAVTGLDLNIAP